MINKIIRNAMAKSGGQVEVVKVPPEKRPTGESLSKLEREISAQVDANNAMSDRSYIYANKI